jgi:hypothetical protein
MEINKRVREEEGIVIFLCQSYKRSKFDRSRIEMILLLTYNQPSFQQPKMQQYITDARGEFSSFPSSHPFRN